MAKVVIIKDTEKANYEVVAKNIRKAMVNKGIKSISEVARETGWCYPTAYARVNTPKNLRLSDLIILSELLGVSAESLLSGVN